MFIVHFIIITSDHQALDPGGRGPLLYRTALTLSFPSKPQASPSRAAPAHPGHAPCREHGSIKFSILIKPEQSGAHYLSIFFLFWIWLHAGPGEPPGGWVPARMIPQACASLPFPPSCLMTPTM